MATKDIIASGIGFSPGSVKFIVTRGLGIGAAILTSGGAVKLRKKKRKRKEFTKEEIKGLEVIHGYREPVPTVHRHPVDDVPIDQPEPKPSIDPIELKPSPFAPPITPALSDLILKPAKVAKKVKLTKSEIKTLVNKEKMGILDNEEEEDKVRAEEMQLILLLIQAHNQ